MKRKCGLKRVVRVLIFADGGKEFELASKRLTSQLEILGPSWVIELFDLERIRKEDQEQWMIHSDFIAQNERGLGFWLWKPWIHRIALRKYPNDILIYLDVGCDILLTSESKKRFRRYLEVADKKGLFMFQMLDNEERQYTQCSTWQLAEILANKEKGSTESDIADLHGGQMSASFMIWNPGPLREKIIEKWFEISLSDNYRHISGIDARDSECQFHMIENYEERYKNLIMELEKTHYLSWRFPFVWENWTRKGVKPPRMSTLARFRKSSLEFRTAIARDLGR